MIKLIKYAKELLDDDTVDLIPDAKVELRKAIAEAEDPATILKMAGDIRQARRTIRKGWPEGKKRS